MLLVPGYILLEQNMPEADQINQRCKTDTLQQFDGETDPINQSLANQH